MYVGYFKTFSFPRDCVWNFILNNKTKLFPVQIPELAKCSVLMRERSRVEETIHAMQRAGVGNLQVSVTNLIRSETELTKTRSFLDVR